MLENISNFIKKNATSIVFGMAIGYLGSHVVKIIKEYGSHSPLTRATLHVICLSQNEQEIKTVSLSELKSSVTFEELNSLRADVGWPTRSDETWNDILIKATNIVCIKKDDQLVGYGCFTAIGRMGSIYDISVHHDHQKQKIGTLIMNHLVSQIKAKKPSYTSVVLSGWKGNTSVLEFYKKFGFDMDCFAMESCSDKLKFYKKV